MDTFPHMWIQGAKCNGRLGANCRASALARLSVYSNCYGKRLETLHSQIRPRRVLASPSLRGRFLPMSTEREVIYLLEVFVDNDQTWPVALDPADGVICKCNRLEARLSHDTILHKRKRIFIPKNEGVKVSAQRCNLVKIFAY